MSFYLLEGPSGLTELLYKKSELFPEEHMLIKHTLFHFFEINFHFKLGFYVTGFLLLESLAWDHSNKLVIKTDCVNSVALMNATPLSTQEPAKNFSEAFWWKQAFWLTNTLLPTSSFTSTSALWSLCIYWKDWKCSESLCLISQGFHLDGKHICSVLREDLWTT